MIKNEISKFIDSHPLATEVICYGSKVIKPKDNDDKSLIDMIYVVDDSYRWHQDNMVMNPSDYFKTVKKKLISKRFSKGVIWLPYLTLLDSQEMFKIGVVQIDEMLDDLKEMRTTTFFGRLSKPIHLFKTNPIIEEAVENNRCNILYISLILMGKQSFFLDDLLYKICSLSYMNDVREIFKCENPNKIKNIVLSSYDELKEIYLRINEKYHFFIFDEESQLITLSISNLLEKTPDIPLEILDILSQNTDINIIREKILSLIKKKNFETSFNMAVSSFMLNGLSTSLKYVKAKRKKYKKSCS